MLRIFKASELGHFKNDWLDSKHHFSFSDYYDQNRMAFGTLRVINDDVIKAGSGFGFHPHKDMEIITFVREGTVIHRDNLGNEGRTEAGDVQVMSAGTGIVHAEFADPKADTKLFQIWIMPRARGLAPRWDQRSMPKKPVANDLDLLVSGRAADQGKDALVINQDAAIYGGRIEKGTVLNHTVRDQAYIVVSDGQAKVNGTVMKEGDGAELRGDDSLTIEALEDATLLVIEVGDQ